MKVRFLYSTVLFLVSVGVSADIPDLDRHTESEHWDQADVVAFVTIESGTYLDNVGANLVAKQLEKLKGELPETANISVRFPSMSFPDQLGSSYLVFLIRGNNGTYSLMQETHSSIRVLPVDIDSAMDIWKYAPRKSDQPIDWYSYAGSLWIIECTTRNGYGSYCEGERELAGHALLAAGAVKGR